ncbi:MAG: hypothetical protein MZV65_44975 [Chromatiales bacterium]|nr:hypothetical protein [Chromatiales bacterium]
MIPTPAVFRVARLDMAARLPADLRTTEVPVFYATAARPGRSRQARTLPGCRRRRGDAGQGLGAARPARLAVGRSHRLGRGPQDLCQRVCAAGHGSRAPRDRVHAAHDAALGFSRVIAGASRLGRPDIADLSVQDIERLAAGRRFQAVDVTDVRGAHEMGGMRGPGYWFANDWISTDVALSLRHSTPAQRCLTPGPRRVVWTFPENYVDCLVQRLGAAYPELRRSAPKGP